MNSVFPEMFFSHWFIGMLPRFQISSTAVRKNIEKNTNPIGGDSMPWVPRKSRGMVGSFGNWGSGLKI